MTADVRRTAIVVLNLLFAIACGGWFWFVVISGSGWGRLLLAGLIVVLGVASLLSVYAWKKGSRRSVGMSLVVWFLVSMAGANAIVHHENTSGVYRVDDKVGWRPKSGIDGVEVQTAFGEYVFSTDRYGARSKKSKRVDEFIPYLIQGDSNLYGVTLKHEETLGEVINSRLEEAAFYNVGVPGYDVNHFYFQFDWLEKNLRIGKRIIFFNHGNDYQYSALAAVYGNRRPYLSVEEGRITEHRENVNVIMRQAYGNRFIEKYEEYDARLRIDPAKSWADDYSEWLVKIPLAQFVIETTERFVHELSLALRNVERTNRIEMNYPDWLLLKVALWPKPFRSYLDDFASIIEKLKEQHPDTEIVLFPSRSQVIPAERREAFERLEKRGFSKEDFDPLSLNHALRAISDAAEIRMVDLTRYYQGHPDPASLYKQGDAHLNAEGIQIAAKVMAELYGHSIAESDRRSEEKG